MRCHSLQKCGNHSLSSFLRRTTHIFYISEAVREKGGHQANARPVKITAVNYFHSSIVSAFIIFTWCSSFIFFERTDKITQIIETISISNISNGITCSGQFITGLFNTLSVQIIHRCLMGHLRKKTAEVLR